MGRWSFYHIVLGVVVGSVLCILAAYGVAILALYALVSALKP